eukprot:3825284-Rhodomonas_salina.1
MSTWMSTHQRHQTMSLHQQQTPPSSLEPHPGTRVPISRLHPYPISLPHQYTTLLARRYPISLSLSVQGSPREQKWKKGRPLRGVGGAVVGGSERGADEYGAWSRQPDLHHS